MTRNWSAMVPGGGRTVLGAAIALGLGLGYALVPRSDPVDAPETSPPEITFYGEALPSSDQAEDVALEKMRARVRGWFELRLPTGETRKLSYGSLGVQIDRTRLRQLLRDARDSTSPLRRTRRRESANGPVELPAPLVVSTGRALPVLERLKEELDRKPANARLNLDDGSVIDERIGWLVDVDASLSAISRALGASGRGADLVVLRTPPERTAAQLAAIEHDAVLAHFETSYDRAERSAARTFNLRLAASRLDGTVLMPGETFDFNDVVGPRDEAHGYKVAPVIAQGELVDGIGGGTCQVSGTLHGAAFFAGLDIVERYPHTRPSSYIKMGMDATVVYPTINFRLRNPYDFPVVLRQTVQGGVVRSEVRGKGPPPTVTLVRRILEATPYPELERPDGRLAEGKRVLSQRGVPGFKLKRYRIIRRGPHAVREAWHESYPPTTQVVRRGTGEKRPGIPEQDHHPEYLADELLVMTSSAKAGAEPTFRTKRERGRFGERGWTQEAGMPTFRRE